MPDNRDNPDSNKKDGFYSKRIVRFPDHEEREKIKKKKLEEKSIKTGSITHPPFFTDKIKKIPIVTKTTLAILLIIQCILSILPSSYTAQIQFFGGFVPGAYWGILEWSWFRIISPISNLLIHADWMHLAFNFVMMLIMGSLMEPFLGPKRTLLLFIVFGICGNFAYMLIDPFSTIPLIGASGAIEGFFALFLIFQNQRQNSQIRNNLFPLMLFWIGFNIVIGLLINNIGWQAHVGGFVAGWSYYEFFLKKNTQK